MKEWQTPEYRAAQEADYERIRAKHPALVTKQFGCYAGWHPILERLLGEIQEIISEGGGKFSLRQVKEKMGGLRFYWSYGDAEPLTLDSQAVREANIRERISLAVFAAECRSASTCEVCGKPGLMLTRQQGGFLATRCEAHGDGMVPWHPPEEQIAFVPEMRGSDGRRYVFDREADKVMEVRDDDG